MKNWLKLIRENVAKEKDDRDENIASLYEIIEGYLTSLDYHQIKGMREEFLPRYQKHLGVIKKVIKPSPGEMEANKAMQNPAAPPAKERDANIQKELIDLRLKEMERKMEGLTENLKERLSLRIEAMEKSLSETTRHHHDLIEMLQHEVHEQNRRMFVFFNKVWWLVIGLIISLVVGGAALVITLLS
jgi:hypothetical protein